MPVIGRTKLPECFSEIAMNAMVQQEDWSLPRNLPKETVQIEKKRKDCAFRRQFDEKPSHIPGCPDTETATAEGFVIGLPESVCTYFFWHPEVIALVSSKQEQADCGGLGLKHFLLWRFAVSANGSCNGLCIGCAML